MNITPILLSAWAIGFVFFTGFGLLCARITGVGDLTSMVVCAAAWPVLSPIRLVIAFAARRADTTRHHPAHPDRR